MGTLTTPHSRRSGTALVQPEEWSKGPSSVASAREEARRGAYSFWYVEPPGAARTKLADLFTILLDGIYLKRGFRERGR